MADNCSNLEKFKDEIAVALKAKFPLLYVSTWEEERMINVISDLCRDARRMKTERKLHIWRSTEGIVSYEHKDNKLIANVEKDTKAPMQALAFIEKVSMPAVFILCDFHIYFGWNNRPCDSDVIRKIKDISMLLRRSQISKSIIFASPVLQIPLELQKEINIIDFKLPSSMEIMEILDTMIDTNASSGKININVSKQDKERLVDAALGLTLQEAENAIAKAMVVDGQLHANDVRVILQEKYQVIKKTGILEFVHSDINIDDVGGLQNLKKWVGKRNNSWLESAKEYCLPAPKGVLITGVPGCGKSLVAKSISAMWQLPLLRLDMGRIFSGILGSSEENIRRAIQTAEAVAPSILWIDEIEKGFGSATSGSGGNDGGTSSRIFGTFLTWMQEKEEPVFVIATANNISQLPPEMMRKGRFDEIFFVDLPIHEERKDIFKLHLNKRLKSDKVRGYIEINDDLLDSLAKISEGFSGAEIEQAVISALFDAYTERRPLEEADMKRAIRNTVPLSKTQQEQIKGIRDWANERAVAATYSEAEIKKLSNSNMFEDFDEDEDEEEDVGADRNRGGRVIEI